VAFPMQTTLRVSTTRSLLSVMAVTVLWVGYAAVPLSCTAPSSNLSTARPKFGILGLPVLAVAIQRRYVTNGKLAGEG